MNEEYQKTVQKSIERFLRSEIFRVFGLTLLKYDIIFTENVPLGAPSATDFKRIFINPNDSFLTDCKVTMENIYNFILSHEVGHIILMHDARIGSRDKTLWGYATDYMLNLLLHNIEIENKVWENQQKLVILNIQKFKDHILFDECFQGMLEEEIYDKLEKEGKFKKETQKVSYKQFLDNVGVPSEGISSDEKIEVTKSELTFNNVTKKKVFVNFPKTQSQIDNRENGSDNTDFDNKLARTMFETNILSRGFENKDFKKFLRRRFNVKIPWKTILRDSILIELQKSSDISYGRPRMAWLCQPSLPYLPNYEDEEILGTLVILIDESASIKDTDIADAITIAKESDSYYKNIYVIKHDTIVHWDKFYPDKLTSDDINELLVRRHSGGTSHKNAFEKVMEFQSKPDCYVSLVLAITDLASDIEQVQHILPDRIPRIYLQNDSNWNYRNVKGKIIKIQ